MRLVYHPDYDLRLGDHVFPSSKFRLICERLLAEGVPVSEFATPEPATREQIRLVHTEHWVRSFVDGEITDEQERVLEIPYSPETAKAFLWMTGGTILAARLAIENGAAMNVGGGFHHAFAGHGEGFCAIHDVAVAIRALIAEGRIRRALVVDLDVHHGNGTSAIFANSPEVLTISMHQLRNYPPVKPPSSIDVNLDDRTGDARYLELLDRVYPRALAGFAPDLVMYVAGSDPYFDDQLGGLALTMEGMRRRDEIVFAAAAARGIPVCATTAGGYARKLADTAELHAITAHLALRTRASG